MRFIIILVIFAGIMLLAACKEVDNLIDPDKAPELDPQGIVVSADRVAPYDTVTAKIKATNPVEGPLSYEWTTGINGGTFIQPADKDSVRWIAPLNGGVYEIKVKVSNSKRSVRTSRQIEVISASKPLVDITTPADNAYFVLFQDVFVQARAEHENGILRVKLFVNDSLISEMTPKPAHLYELKFKSSADMVGKAIVKVEAEAFNHVKNTDQISINVQGIIPGRNGK